MSAIRVEVWSDIACPWCWVGKRRLETAVAAFAGQVEVAWRAFELDPSAPPSAPADVDYVARLAAKYGCARERAEAMVEGMTALGAADDLYFDFAHIRPGNTFDAHRLISWARGQGRDGLLVERLFAAYLAEGRAIDDVDVLAELAAEVGLEREAARALLGSDAHAGDVRSDERRAASMGISGVPFFLVAGEISVVGAQSSEILQRALRAAESDEAVEGGQELACSTDACELDAGDASARRPIR